MKSARHNEAVHIGLPLKIAGIVFWGLVAVGLLMVAMAMPWLERIAVLEHETSPRQIVTSVREQLLEDNAVTLDALRPSIPPLMQELNIPAVSIERSTKSITFGKPEPGLESFTSSFTSADLQTGGLVDVVVTVYQQTIEQALLTRKKQLMLVLGISFFAFGLIIQWILQKVITKPFHQMIATAELCSHGNEARFNENRFDEFGYLSRFINKAMAALQARQLELSDALQRAQAGEHALFDEKNRAEVTLNSIAEGVITTDRDGKVRFMNPVAERLSGWKQEEATGRDIDDIIHLIDEQTGDFIPCAVSCSLRNNKIERNLQSRLLVRKGGEEIAVAESAAPMHDATGNIVGAVLVFDDVRQTRELTRQLSHQASHDALTGLLNRREFEARLQQALENTRSNGEHYALCYIDLDQFKIINDTCGHTAGDELLRVLGSLLHKKLRDSDIVARLGGDEFGILLQGCTMADAEKLAGEIRKVIRALNFVWDGKSFEIGASIGIVPLSGTTQSVAEALSSADVACYAAKEQGRDRVHVSEPDDKELKRHRSEMRWVGRIRDALKEGRLTLYRQSIVPVHCSDQRELHTEILLRMIGKDEKLIPPGRFLRAAEQYGLMPEIDRWVVEHSLRWLANEIRLCQSTTIMAVNLSGQSLTARGFLSSIVDLLHDSKVPPEQICFEITETAAIANFETALKFMRLLHGMGCRFALDDFGSGMSSFAYLKQLPVDYLKIDGSYVRDLLHDPVDRAMVQSVNQIGHAMGIQTIAEYVEDRSILGALATIGVDFAQGYAIDKPQAVRHTEAHCDSVVSFIKPGSGQG
ncbi:PAS domain S-box-containing protein/diguanylate cyclase (GGDEF)-like protein [Thiogranum longum]|uniref:PAS domain S-box-containing protein/diguanylate cyclase (GGDEF)-like protein n=1 Tax=Thiogranum longum TaxID=1537524 RepID=A0A4R1H9L6_9GAMM|nr:EAL domain-containing protein [Thiogranum longum]TCK16810.1 PAS domain S-box-containing protein/diguanylate cyclase (GGDEF)-like protein [Thiogranum longum]